MTNEALYLAAMRIEALALRLGAPRARVEAFGIGANAAEDKATALLREQAAPNVLFGFSGALQASLRPGDLVVATELGTVGSDETVALTGAADVARHLQTHGLSVVPAPVVTSRRLVVGDEARAKAAAGGAVAVDMESWFFAPLARDRALVVVRAIVDVPGREVRSAATPVAAMRAVVALARSARALHESTFSFEVQPQYEQAGDS
ncbi:MAG: hypothetical protein WB770_05130 [Acidimicrobiales bacterium]